jgi:hypothetical protein
MELPPLGQRQQRPAESEPTWASYMLAEVRRQRVGDVPVEVEDTKGQLFLAYLDKIDGDTIRFETDVGLTSIRSEDVAGFTLLAEPGPDTADEIRG